jgi:hypothetical protein
MEIYEEYSTLYHYTTWEGLDGILSGKSLWATHCRFLNDYSETLLMKDQLVEILAMPVFSQACQKALDCHPNRKHMKQVINDDGGFKAYVRQISRDFVSGMYKKMPYGGELYMASFCGESADEYVNANGVLSQWRGYGQDGGFALVFNTKGLTKMLGSEYDSHSYIVAGLGEVVYSNEEEKLMSEFSTEFPELHKFMEAMVSSLFSGRLDPLIQDVALPHFVSCISRFKHQGFKEENEVRIYAYPTVHNEEYLKIHKQDKDQLKPEKERKLREGNGERIPYIELFSSLNQNLPIERIIVGPHKNRHARVAALRAMPCCSGIDVTPSDIPFVS